MNHENRRTEFCGTSAGANGERPAKRIAAADRRERLLETAAEEFACAGLRGTTTAALAKRAGISEPVLYIHFENKDRLFRETVERSVEKRLRMLEANPAQVDDDTLVDCVERMAEATVAVCLSDAANAALTAWALLEAPEYAAELHRNEVGSVCLLWERRLAELIPEARSRALISMRLAPYAVQACMAYGLWLASLRHSHGSAAPLACQFAEGIAMAAANLLASES